MTLISCSNIKYLSLEIDKTNLVKLNHKILKLTKSLISVKDFLVYISYSSDRPILLVWEDSVKITYVAVAENKK